MDELTEYLASSGEDGLWDQILSEARQVAEREPLLVSYLFVATTAHCLAPWLRHTPRLVAKCSNRAG